MLKLVWSRDNKKSAKKPTPKRQAIFVLDHDLYGRVVINRRVFERLLRRPANECGPQGDLVKTADQALQAVLGSDMFELEKLGMFPVRGLSERPIEFTVFFVKPSRPAVLNAISSSICTKLEEHPLYGHISPYFDTRQPVRKRRGMG